MRTTQLEALGQSVCGPASRRHSFGAKFSYWLLMGGPALAVACGPSGGTGPKDASSDVAPGDASGSADASDGGAPFPFQPSNISLAEIAQAVGKAKVENESGACSIATDASSPSQSCFSSPIKAVTQPDGSTVNLIVVKSLAVQSTGAITVTGGVPLIVVSLADVTLFGSVDAASVSLGVGPGGAGPAASNAAGMGGGGGAAGSGATKVGGSGGSYCGLGGNGGGQTTVGMAYGNVAIRPLVGGSAGGGGAVGSGAGGGGLQITAAGTLTLNTSASITAGGQGGPIGGIATDQNAGGGGSGGSILLEATNVTLAGTMAANGGGGGGDYSGTGGADATPNATPAPGGAGGTSDAAGGAGGAASVINGSPGMTGASVNSGGGGGGTGRIRINSMSGSATVSGVLSPAATTSCVTQGPLRTTTDGP